MQDPEQQPSWPQSLQRAPPAALPLLPAPPLPAALLLVGALGLASAPAPAPSTQVLQDGPGLAAADHLLQALVSQPVPPREVDVLELWAVSQLRDLANSAGCWTGPASVRRPGHIRSPALACCWAMRGIKATLLTVCPVSATQHKPCLPPAPVPSMDSVDCPPRGGVDGLPVRSL